MSFLKSPAFVATLFMLAMTTLMVVGMLSELLIFHNAKHGQLFTILTAVLTMFTILSFATFLRHYRDTKLEATTAATDNSNGLRLI